MDISDTIQSISTTPPVKCSLKVGDVVVWENDYGVIWVNRIIGFDSEVCKYGKFIHLDTDAHWFSHHPKEIRNVNEKPWKWLGK